MNLMQIMICLAALADTPDCPPTMGVLARRRPCRSKAARVGTKRKLTPRFPMSPTYSCNRTRFDVSRTLSCRPLPTSAPAFRFGITVCTVQLPYSLSSFSGLGDREAAALHLEKRVWDRQMKMGVWGAVLTKPKFCFSMRLVLTCPVPFCQRLAHLCIRLSPSDSPIALDRPDPQFRLWRCPPHVSPAIAKTLIKLIMHHLPQS